MHKIIIANWKMNGSSDLIEEFSNKLKQTSTATVIICPPTNLISLKTNLIIGSQDISALHPSNGAYTGEISGQMLKASGCKYALIGHSERREYFHEDSNILEKKLINALTNNLTPIYCFGETIEDFNTNNTLAAIENQLKVLDKVYSIFPNKEIILAYEPVWSIGTGLIPKIHDITKICEFIHKKFAQKPKIVYGGSVNSKNADEILNIWPVDGVLVGGASLKIEEFQQIIDCA